MKKKVVISFILVALAIVIIFQYLIECMAERIKGADSHVGTISFPLSISHLHVDEMQTREFNECYDHVKEYYNYIATD